MSAVEVALRFIAAWLVIGLGIFIAMGSFGAMRPGQASGPRVWHGAYAVPFLLAVALVALGGLGVVRTVPW